MLEDSAILLSIELPGTAAHVVEAVRALGLEGIVAKRRDFALRPGERSSAWLEGKARQASGVRRGWLLAWARMESTPYWSVTL